MYEYHLQCYARAAGRSEGDCLEGGHHDRHRRKEQFELGQALRDLQTGVCKHVFHTNVA